MSQSLILLIGCAYFAAYSSALAQHCLRHDSQGAGIAAFFTAMATLLLFMLAAARATQ